MIESEVELFESRAIESSFVQRLPTEAELQEKASLITHFKGGQPRKSFVFLNTTTQTITSYRNKNWHVAKRTFPLPARYGGMLKRVKAVRLCWHSAKSRQDIANYQL